MKRALIMCFLVIVFLSVGCEKKTDSRLTGTWKSDAQKSMDYNIKHVVMTKSQRDNYESIFGHLTIEIANGTVREHMPEHLVKLKQKEVKQPPSTTEKELTILESDNNSVAIMTKDSSGHGGLMLLHYEDGYYWTYIGDSLREYFKKVQ